MSKHAQKGTTMTQPPSLDTPWELAFDRDGTEDFGMILDANGEKIVSSLFCSYCWLPECDEDETPVLVYQLKLMAAAPKLLAMLKIAVATADPAKHKWVKEAREAIAEAMGQEFDRKEAEAACHLHRAAPRLFAALETCHAMLEDYMVLTRFVDSRLKPNDRAGTQEIEQARQEAFAALYEARGEIAF